MKWTVTLDKGPKGQRTWEHDLRCQAIRRARALSELHSCSYTEHDDGRIIVHAGQYYGG